MARRRNADWNLPERCQDWEQAGVAVLMDIRDELQALRRLANCPRIPVALDAMRDLGIAARRRKRKRKNNR